MRQSKDDIRESEAGQSGRKNHLLVVCMHVNSLQVNPSTHRLSPSFTAARPAMISLFKFAALAGLVAVASGDGHIDEMDETIERGRDDCGCIKENIRKITVCRTFQAGGEGFGPGSAQVNLIIKYLPAYNITDLNVLVSLDHPKGDEITGKLMFEPDGSSTIQQFKLFDYQSLSDGALDRIQFTKVKFDDDTANVLPSGPNSNNNELILPEGYYKPEETNGFNSLTGELTKGTWTLAMSDDQNTNHGNGVVTEFCVIFTTNTAGDPAAEVTQRRLMQAEAAVLLGSREF